MEWLYRNSSLKISPSEPFTSVIPRYVQNCKEALKQTLLRGKRELEAHCFLFISGCLKALQKNKIKENCGCRCRCRCHPWLENIKLSTNTKNLLDLLLVVFLRVWSSTKMFLEHENFRGCSTETPTYHSISQSMLGLKQQRPDSWRDFFILQSSILSQILDFEWFPTADDDWNCFC